MSTIDEVPARQASEAKRAAARKACGNLPRQPHIIQEFLKSIARRGVVGEQKVLALLYLAITSRLLGRIVSAVIKAPSSAGKSYVTEQVLRYFPDSAYVAFTAMSEKALIYDDTPLAHRMLVVFEAGAVTSEFQQYLVRSLLSEGCLRYMVVEKTKAGSKSRIISREGPTGLITTTTAIGLHQENETRVLSLTVSDTREQTAQIMAATATHRDRPVPSEWLALQEYLSLLERPHVVINFGRRLAELIPPLAVRLRRDFKMVLTLIEAHALLHCELRPRDKHNRIIAVRADYEVIRDLMGDILAEGLRASVPPHVRETVAAIQASGGTGLTVGQLAEVLKIDPSAASRRARHAEQLGYITKLKHGRTITLFLGSALPHDQDVLPRPEMLFGCPGPRRSPNGKAKAQKRGSNTTIACTPTPTATGQKNPESSGPTLSAHAAPVSPQSPKENPFEALADILRGTPDGES